MYKIEAPFADEQVEKLKIWQTGLLPDDNSPWYQDHGGIRVYGIPVHPFTCCGHGGCTRPPDLNEGVLIPTTEGWNCPCGKYTQNWCYDIMVL